MSNQRITTTCPQCQTQFYVSESQLKVAKGHVRCGNCLHVFSVTNLKKAQKKPLPATPIDIPLNSENKMTAGLAAEPLQLKPELTHPPASILQRTFFVLATLILILMLFSQAILFMKSEWLQDEGLRTIYRPFYAVLGADLPPRQSIDLIETGQLIVQPHDIYKDAIRISILLENKASFKQPFPALLLSFEDTKGRMVSQRKLEPSDYINLAVFPNALMPQNQSVQIQLDFMDPGRRASGYQIRLLPGNSFSG